MTETILIVDDDIHMRLAIRRVLKHKGYACMLASGGEEVLALLATSPDIALIISDICMPGIDGLALLQAVKRSAPAIPFILITAHGAVPDAVKALKAGASDYLLDRKS